MAKQQTKPTSYQELNQELETILADLQRDDLDIDRALENYRRGQELVEQLTKYLKTAKNQINELKTQTKVK